MFSKRIAFCLALVFGIGATTKLSAQCTAPTSVSGTYCTNQYAEYKITDSDPNVQYRWYEMLSGELRNRGYGQDGTGRYYVSTGTVTGPTTYYYSKETNQNIIPSIAATGGTTQLVTAGKYAMPFASTVDFKLNSVEVVVNLTSATNVYGFQIMYSNTDSVQTFSDWFTGTRDGAEFELISGTLYRVTIPITGIDIKKGIGQSLEFRSVANAGQNVAVDGIYWWNETAYNGGSYASNSITVLDPEKTIATAKRTPFISNWNITTICDPVAITSVNGGANCCSPVGTNFNISTSSFVNFPATLSAVGTDISASGLNYYWYDEDNVLVGSGVDKKTQSIIKPGIYTLKVVRRTTDLNSVSCVGKKLIDVDNKSIYTSNDTTICIGAPFLLNAYGAESKYVWKAIGANATIGNAGIASKTTQSSALNITVPGVYEFEVSGEVKKNNIAYDGKFEKYDKRTNNNIITYPPSFETTYGNSTSIPIGTSIVNNNEFIVDNKISAYGNIFCPDPSFWQKTNGTDVISRGNILYADAFNNNNTPIRSATIASLHPLWRLSNQPVLPNTLYTFSMDVSNWNSKDGNTAEPPEIMLLVNGQAIPISYNGNVVSTGTDPFYKFPTGLGCTWQTITGTWNSGSNTTATIAIAEVGGMNTGHEFAVDDITFSSGFETKRDTIVVTVKDCSSISAKADSASVCAGSLVNLSATTNGFIEKWVDPSGTNLGATTSIKAYPSTSTIYTVTAQFPIKSVGLNRDFEDGYNGFSSGLKMQSGAQIDNENYKIVKGNEAFWTNNTGALVPFSDHTSGNGSMLVTRTANDHRTKILYSQTVQTTIGKQYGVSFYLKNILADLSTSAPVDLQININGLKVLDINHPLTHNWEFYSYLFSATTASTKIDIVGRDTYNTYIFRLLAFDDIVIAEAGLPKVANVSVSTKDCDILTARTDTAQCIGKEVKLYATTNGFITSWTPTTGLSDITIPNPKLTVSATQTMTVEAQFPLKRFITNSDFNEGNTGFGSGLTFSGANAPGDNGYMIGKGNEDNLYNPFNKPTKDHTTGTGLFMIAKTKSDNIQVVINQTIAVTNGKSYGISFWAIDLHSQPANTTNVVFQIRIGGNVVPKTFTIPQDKLWHKIEYNWTATTTANVLVEIINPKETQGREHAFGLDDLVLAELGNTKKKEVIITAKDCSSLTPMAGKEVCIGDPLTLTATTDGVITGWGPADLVSNTTVPNPKVYPVLPSNVYTVTAKFPVEKLFSNSDFEAGDVGFTTSLTPASSSPGSGTYIVANGSNPALYDPFLSTIKDHTTSSGKFLMFQTKASTEQVVFSKEITLIKDSSYNISFFMYDMHARPDNTVPIEMQVKVGNELVKTFSISKLAADKKWEEFQYTWVAKTAGLVTISLVIPAKITNTLAIGIDDFSIIRLGGKKTAKVTITTKDCFVLKANVIGTCQGDSIKVVAETSGLFAGWKVKTGAAIIKNPMSDTTWVKPSEPTVLEVAAEFTLGNLVSNGDFEGGQDVGFTSGYVYRTPTIDQGNYTITTNSNAANPGNFFKIPDHSTGDYTGNMMVIDPNTTPNVVAYSTKVTVKNGAKYAISAWVASLHTGYANPPVLQFFVNNEPLGVLDADSLPVWRQFYSTWTANLDGEIEIKVVNKNNQGGGNDYALDDIEFTEISSLPRTITLNVPACIVCKKVTSGALSSSKTIICSGENTTITGALPSQETNTANTFTYKWEKREGSGAYVEIPLATGKDYTTPALTQTTTFRRTAIGLLSCRDTANTTITVNPKPSKPKVTGDTTLCIGEKLDLKATSTGTIKNYTWTGISGTTFGNSSGTLNDLMTKTSVISSDSVKIKIVAATTNGCKDSSNVLVAVYKNPTRPIFTGDSVLCENAKLDIKATSLATKGVTVKGYTWKGFTASNGILITNSAGTLQDKIGKTSVSNAENNLAMKVIVESMVGCKDSSNVKLTINPSPTKPTVTTNATCQDSVVKFNGTPLDANHAFVWYDSDTITNSVPIGKPTPSTANVVAPKVYYVTQKNSTTNCESKKDSVWVTIKPRTSITTNPKLLDSLCEGEPYIINVVAGGSGPFSYQWSKNGKDTSGFTNAELKIDPIKPTDAGTYKVKVTGACGAPTSQNAVLVVKTKPVIITEPSNASDCVGADVTLTVQASGSLPLEYQWTQDGTPKLNANDLALTPIKATDGGKYIVEIKNSCGTATSKEVTVEVTTNVTPKVSLTTKNDTVLCGSATAKVKLKAYALQGGGKNPKYTFEVAGIPFLQDPTKDSLELPIPENTTDAVVTIPVIVTLESNSTCLAGTAFATDTITFIVDPIVKPAMFNIAEVKDTICVANRNLTVGNLPTNYLGLWTSTRGADATNGNVTNISKGEQTLTTYSVSSPLKKCAALSDTVTTLHSADPTAPAVTVDNVKSKEICISDKVIISGALVSSTFEKANWSVVPNSTRLANGETSFDASGTYKYYLTISNPSSGCKPSIDSATVKVDALPDVAKAGADENMCGDEYVLKGNKPTIGKGKWTSNNIAVTFQNGVDSLFNSVGINMPKATTVTFTWQIDNGKCIGTPETVEITRFGDIVKPIAGLTDDTTICIGGSANLVAKSEANTSNGEWHKWLNPAKDSINNTRIASSGILNNEGKFIYYYAISNKLCGSQLDSFVVNVDAATPVPVLSATLVSPKEYSLVECTEKVSSLPGTMPAYGMAMWKKDVLLGGQGTIVDPNSATSEFNSLVSPGQKSVLYWWQKNGVCDADSAKLTIDKPAIISDAVITLLDGIGNTLTSKDICAGSNYVLKAGDIRSDKGESYVWSKVNGSSVDLSSDKTTQNQALTLSTSLTNADVTQIRLTIKPPVGVPCPEDTISVKLAVHTVPSGYTIDGTTALCEDASADFTLKTITSTLPITNYNWKVSSTLDGATFVSQDDNLQKATYKFEAKINATPFTSGIVMANVANKCGNGSDVNSQSVTINLRPRNFTVGLELPTNPEICSSETGVIEYKANVIPALPAGTKVNWYWEGTKFTTTTTESAILPTRQYFNLDGTFKLQAKLENTCGESKANDVAWSIEQNIKVNPSKTLGVTIAPAPTFSDSVCVENGGTNTFMATPITSGNNLSNNRTYTFKVTDTSGVSTEYPLGKDSIFVTPSVLNDGDQVTVVLKDPNGCFDGAREALSDIPSVVNGFVFPSSTIIPSTTKACEDRDDIELKVIRTPNIKGEFSDAGVKWYRNGVYLSQYDTTKSLPIYVGTPSESGKYTVKVKGSVCLTDSISKDSVAIKVYEKPEFSFSTYPFIIIYKEGNALPMPVEYLKLPITDTATTITAKWRADNSKYDSWLLKPDSIRTLITSAKEETEFNYNLTVTTGSKDSAYCSTSNNLWIINSLPLIIPNAFSPNGDGVNDTWVITGLNKYKKVTIRIFNRWGNQVFFDQDGYKEAWDGNINGVSLASGTYYAIIELSGSPDGSDQTFTRSLTIVR